MAAIAWADVVGIAAEFATVSPIAQGFYLGFVNVELNVSMFGGEDAAKTKLARIYLAAHLATLDRLRGSAIAGPVIAETRGKVVAVVREPVRVARRARHVRAHDYEALVRTSLARWPTVA